MAYGCNVAEELSKISYHSIDILTAVNEAVSFAVSDFSNDIEGIILQPLSEIADFIVRSEQCFCLV